MPVERTSPVLGGARLGEGSVPEGSNRTGSARVALSEAGRPSREIRTNRAPEGVKNVVQRAEGACFSGDSV
jgi:hypothetical protein